jgi:hypothetical protein
MDRPTENLASKALKDCCVVTYCWVTMEMKSTSRVLDTDICLLLLMWEASSHSFSLSVHYSLLYSPITEDALSNLQTNTAQRMCVYVSVTAIILGAEITD